MEQYNLGDCMLTQKMHQQGQKVAVFTTTQEKEEKYEYDTRVFANILWMGNCVRAGADSRVLA